MIDTGPTVPLREYIESILAERETRYQQRFEAQQAALAAAFEAAKELVAAALAAADRAVQKADATSEKRFEGVNEFRQTLSDQAGTFATKDEVDAKVTGLSKEVAVLTTALAAMQGSNRGLSAGWGYLIGVAGFAIAAYATFAK